MFMRRINQSTVSTLIVSDLSFAKVAVAVAVAVTTEGNLAEIAVRSLEGLTDWTNK